jgi:argininosuccinate lyase
MEAAACNSYTLATDLADYLVRKGTPFREAHQTVAELVRYAERESKPLSVLSLEEYRGFSPLFDHDVFALDIRASIAARDVPGGTAPSRVAEALRTARERLKEDA